jgi:hypothetical protein
MAAVALSFRTKAEAVRRLGMLARNWPGATAGQY